MAQETKARWQHRQDDIDSMKKLNNQGQDKKPYSCEWKDKYENGQSVFNASDSNFLNLLLRAYYTDVNSRGYQQMRKLLGVLETLGGGSGTHHERLMAVMEKYFYRVKRYFPKMLINEDMMRYELARIAMLQGTYQNDTDPLTQELGDHYSAEKGFDRKRMAYLMSKYVFGDFSADSQGGTISVRTSGSAKIRLTPAIDLYPCIRNGVSVTRGGRTKAGEVCELETVLLGGDQQMSVLGADWLQDIGDWHTIPAQGGMTVTGRMLKQLVLGSEDDAEGINLAITGLTVSGCGALRTVNLWNLSTLTGSLDLTGSKLLQEVLAKGTALTAISLPAGAPLTRIDYPATNRQIRMDSLPLIGLDGVNYMDCAETVAMFVVSGCGNLGVMRMLADIIAAQERQGDGHALTRVYADGFDEESGDATLLDRLAMLTEGYQAVDRDGYDMAGVPVLSGVIRMTAPVYEDSVDALLAAFGAGGLRIDASLFYIRFEDAEVWRICCTNWGDYTEVKTTVAIDGETGDVTTTVVRTPVHMLNTTATRGEATTEVTVTPAAEATGEETTGTTTEKLPVGIMKEQCAAVSSLGTQFQRTAAVILDLTPFTGVTSLDRYAFAYNYMVRRIVIPVNVNSMGGYSFREDPQTLTLIMLPVNPPTKRTENYNIFSNTSAVNANYPMYVPDDSVDAYKEHSDWSWRAAYIKPMSEYAG